MKLNRRVVFLLAVAIIALCQLVYSSAGQSPPETESVRTVEAAKSTAKQAIQITAMDFEDFRTATFPETTLFIKPEPEPEIDERSIIAREIRENTPNIQPVNKLYRLYKTDIGAVDKSQKIPDSITYQRDKRPPEFARKI